MWNPHAGENDVISRDCLRLSCCADSQECVDAVNAVRSAEDLNLALFTAAKTEEDEVEEKSAAEATAYENALYALTCEQINKSTIEPVASDVQWFNFLSGRGQVHANLLFQTRWNSDEAVTFWQTGLEQLGSVNVP
ncbi:hypothetical protein ETH_00022285 [Eimeria tenella]|uniref:Uncharacterized protein n=1 Tax=Eimeria tenella TaxID=5802 RepID=U6KY30_EIMTE|nr:hypothetical protein ETH_00022285 [Eimeria tenella]CDJ41853.1 hypothetical protein ETH_00022285 [Eimeria tenella]|eukprot:XP_013232603.1 hypothetical protein ETH_00022285 [Eimeria tenella]